MQTRRLTSSTQSRAQNDRGGSIRDSVRQALNLVLAIAQPVTAVLAFPPGSDFFKAESDPPIVPAAYAFSIWSLIFGSSIAYAIRQALPRYREDLLLRQCRDWTAAVFFTRAVCGLHRLDFDRDDRESDDRSRRLGRNLHPQHCMASVRDRFCIGCRHDSCRSLTRGLAVCRNDGMGAHRDRRAEHRERPWRHRPACRLC